MSDGTILGTPGLFVPLTAVPVPGRLGWAVQVGLSRDGVVSARLAQAEPPALPRYGQAVVLKAPGVDAFPPEPNPWDEVYATTGKIQDGAIGPDRLVTSPPRPANADGFPPKPSGVSAVPPRRAPDPVEVKVEVEGSLSAQQVREALRRAGVVDGSTSAGQVYEAMGRAPKLQVKREVDHSATPPAQSAPLPDLLASWRATAVRRWHANPVAGLRDSGDTNASHAGRAALLALALFPKMPGAAMLLLIHDLGESLVGGGPGDVSGRAKSDNSMLRAGVDEAEHEALGRLGWHPLLEAASERESMAAKLCDVLDAYLVMLERAPDRRERDGWPKDRERIRDLARTLGVWPRVKAAIRSAKRG